MELIKIQNEVEIVLHFNISSSIFLEEHIRNRFTSLITFPFKVFNIVTLDQDSNGSFSY